MLATMVLDGTISDGITCLGMGRFWWGLLLMGSRGQDGPGGDRFDGIARYYHGLFFCGSQACMTRRNIILLLRLRLEEHYHYGWASERSLQRWAGINFSFFLDNFDGVRSCSGWAVHDGEGGKMQRYLSALWKPAAMRISCHWTCIHTRDHRMVTWEHIAKIKTVTIRKQKVPEIHDH